MKQKQQGIQTGKNRRGAVVILALMLAVALLAGCATPVPQPQIFEGGELLSTKFFAFSAAPFERKDGYEDYVPEEDEALVLVQVTLENTTAQTQSMFDSDFVLRWGEGEADFAWLRDAMDDTMCPKEFSLQPGERKECAMLFTVPKAQTTFVLEYTEYFLDKEGEQYTGDTYRLRLTQA